MPPLPEAAAALLRRFTDLLAAGNHRDALHAASAACHAAPAHPYPHYAYGQAWLALGDNGHAARAFAEAVRLAPNWADAWVNLGLARYRDHSMHDAKIAMHQALRHQPGHQAAAANLAAFMRISGEAEQAAALLEDALARDPADAAARLNRVGDLLQTDRAAEALALLDAAPELPSAADVRCHWLLQRASALLQSGRHADAATVLDDIAAAGPIPPEMAPLLHWRRVLLAEATSDTAAAEDAANAMDRALETMGPAAVPEHRIMGHYDLARFWSNRGQAHLAFGHWQDGHTLLRALQPFSRDAHQGFIDTCIARLDHARLNNGPRAGNADAAPVFIVGMPRSGTTLCEQIIAAHPAAFGAGERPALIGAVHALTGSGHAVAPTAERVAGLDRATLDAAAAHYLAELHALTPDKQRIVDKMPANYLHLGLVGLMLPGARIIHCVRDPRDIGLSIFTFRFHGEHGYAHDLADLGWTIGQQHRLMRHWKAVLPNPVLTVRLDDWVTDFDATLRRVLAHIGLPFDPACERFYESDREVRTVSRTQVRQPVNARGLGRWKPYAADLQPLIAELEAAGTLADWDRPRVATVAGDDLPIVAHRDEPPPMPAAKHQLPMAAPESALPVPTAGNPPPTAAAKDEPPAMPATEDEPPARTAESQSGRTPAAAQDHSDRTIS